MNLRLTLAICICFSLVFLMMVFMDSASATSCHQISSFREIAMQEFENSDRVFYGKVISNEPLPDDSGWNLATINFEVIQSYKDYDTEVISVIDSQHPGLTLIFEEDQEYLVFASYKDNQLHPSFPNLCSPHYSTGDFEWFENIVKTFQTREELDWDKYALETAKEFLHNWDFFQNIEGTKDAGIAPSISMRDSMPPTMTATITIQYTENGKEKFFEKRFNINPLNENVVCNNDVENFECGFLHEKYLNFRGDVVHVFFSSVEELFDRGYLIAK